MSRYLTGESKIEEYASSAGDEGACEYIAVPPSAGILILVFAPMVILNCVAAFDSAIGWSRHWAVALCLNLVYLLLMTMILAEREPGMTDSGRKLYARKLFARLLFIAVLLGIIGFFLVIIFLFLLMLVIGTSGPGAFD